MPWQNREVAVFKFIYAIAGVAIISLLIALIPQRNPHLRCSLDGTKIEPVYEVIIHQKDGSFRKFSCIVSARIWLDANGEDSFSILVTDEITGQKIDAEKAFYVESEAITTPHTKNRIHCFASLTDAITHARQFNGRLVKNPLRFHSFKTIKLVKSLPLMPDHINLDLSPSQKPPCLFGDNILILEKDFIIISSGLPEIKLDGHLGPLDKPPRHLFLLF